MGFSLESPLISNELRGIGRREKSRHTGGYPESPCTSYATTPAKRTQRIQLTDSPMKLVTPYFRSPFTAFAPFAEFERELNRHLQPAQGECRPVVAVPAADIREDQNQVVLTLELPGVAKDSIQVSLHDGVLAISAERRPAEPTPEGTVFRREIHAGRYERRFELGLPVQTDAIKAAYQDGLLTVTLPKAEAAKPRQIQVLVN
jgi:HSP20 family protein